MSLRQSIDAPSDPPSDEENQSFLGNAPDRTAAIKGFFSQLTAPLASTTGTTAQSSSTTPSPALSAFDAMATDSNTKNPVMLAKLVFRRILLLLTTDEQSDSNTPVGYTLALAKDVILGVVMGMLTISLFIVLDHRNIIHFQSAHHVRDVAYSSLSDAATLAWVEEEMDVKFMTVADYEAAKKEVEDVESSLQRLNEKLQERSKEVEQLTKDLEALNEEKKKLMADPALAQLDQFCPSCKWGPTSCAARVEYVMANYNEQETLTKLNLMKQGKCKK